MNGLESWGAYLQWNTTQPQKGQNNAICRIMEGTVFL